MPQRGLLLAFAQTWLLAPRWLALWRCRQTRCPSWWQRSCSPSRSSPPQPQAWHVRKTVLPRKSGLGSSLMFWSAVGFKGRALVWAVLAPLEEAVVIQGKPEPFSTVRRLAAPAWRR